MMCDICEIHFYDFYDSISVTMNSLTPKLIDFDSQAYCYPPIFSIIRFNRNEPRGNCKIPI